MKTVHKNKTVLILSTLTGLKKTTLLHRREKRFALVLAAVDEFEVFLSRIVMDNSYWTKWNVIYDLNGELIGYYRTNNKKVQFRFNYLSSKYQSTSFCHKEDNFDLATGISIALNRSIDKRFCRRGISFKKVYQLQKGFHKKKNFGLILAATIIKLIKNKLRSE